MTRHEFLIFCYYIILVERAFFCSNSRLICTCSTSSKGFGHMQSIPKRQFHINDTRITADMRPALSDQLSIAPTHQSANILYSNRYSPVTISLTDDPLAEVQTAFTTVVVVPISMVASYEPLDSVVPAPVPSADISGSVPSIV
jgi:hypothetical protein